MPNDNESDTVSAAAHQRVVTERDTYKSERDAATAALEDYQKRDAARAALKDKVADPDSVADLITPHLKDVATADVAAHVASDAFKPKLAAFAPAAPAAPPTEGGDGEEGDGEGQQQPPAATEQSGSFGGPSPGQGGGSEVVNGGKQLVKVGSPEYKQLLADPDGMKAAREQGRIVEPARTY